MKKSSRRHILSQALASIVAMACGPRMVSAARAPVRLPEEHHIEIRQFSFKPELLQVRSGDTIIWTNHDIAPHTATARDKSWDSGTIATGKTKKITVTKGFTLNYYCRFHPMMRAKLQIKSVE